METFSTYQSDQTMDQAILFYPMGFWVKVDI